MTFQKADIKQIRQTLKARLEEEEPIQFLAFDGPALVLAMNQEDTHKMVLKLLIQAEAAIFTRITPDQKGKLTSIAKRELGFCTLAIGDGINDEVMLQKANVGIKLVKENN